MTEAETKAELANLYDQLRYNLECLKGFLTTIDAAVRTMLQFQELAGPFQQHLTDGQLLPNTKEIAAQVEVTLSVAQAKAAELRQVEHRDLGAVN